MSRLFHILQIITLLIAATISFTSCIEKKFCQQYNYTKDEKLQKIGTRKMQNSSSQSINVFFIDRVEFDTFTAYHKGKPFSGTSGYYTEYKDELYCEIVDFENGKPCGPYVRMRAPCDTLGYGYVYPDSTLEVSYHLHGKVKQISIINQYVSDITIYRRDGSKFSRTLEVTPKGKSLGLKSELSYWHEDGTLSDYQNDSVSSQYSIGGELVSQRFFDKDRKVHGAEFDWYYSGKVRSVRNYVHGVKSGVWVTLAESGDTIEVKNFAEGKLHGRRAVFHSNGNLRSLEFYENDVPNGPNFAYHENGQLKTEAHSKHGQAHGPWKEYASNGTLTRFGQHENGVPVGVWKYYYENGQLSDIGEFTNGKKSGTWKHYSKQGELLLTEEF